MLRNPAGAVRTHVRTRAAGDWIRRRRTEMGAQAQTDRIRTGARGRALPSDFHRALLEYVVDEAGSMAPLEGCDALQRRLAARGAAEFGGVPEQYLASVADAMDVIERHCRSGPRVNAGTATEPDIVTWWERFVERPLGSRRRRTDVALLAAPGADGRTGVDPPYSLAGDPVGDDAAAVMVLVDALRRRPGNPAVALRAGVGDLVALGLLPEHSAAALISDRDRFAVAAQELSALG